MIPRNTRTTSKPSYEVTAAVHIVTILQDTMILLTHTEGVKYFILQHRQRGRSETALWLNTKQRVNSRQVARKLQETVRDKENRDNQRVPVRAQANVSKRARKAEKGSA